MHHDHSENAMTEVALALAMGFFSLMVLTLVSMGTGSAPAREAVSARMAMPDAASRPESIRPVGSDDLLVIYHAGRLLDRDLAPVDPDTLDPARRTVLALPPGLSFAEAMRVRGRVRASDLIVTALDERWLATLKEMRR